MQNRPFENVQEMNRGLIRNYNDVGVDANDYCPMSVEEIIEFFED